MPGPLVGFLGRSAALKLAKRMGSSNTVKALEEAQKRVPNLKKNARRQFESGK
tara:strand:+ start:169 stop:327 length:159 start_codon:yes stop_codon:yes gene_type:complete